jgi:hypothetical protein
LNEIPGHPSKISVINAGCGGAGPIQELGMLERGLTLKPDLVVLQILPGNDMENCLELVNKRQRAYNVDWHNRLREYQDEGIFPYRAELAVRRASSLYRFIVRTFMHNGHAIVRLLTGTRVLPFSDIPPLPPSEDRPFWLEVNMNEWYPELEEGFELYKKYTSDILDQCSKKGLDLIAYTIPDYNEVDEKAWASFQEQYKGRVEYELLKGLNKVKRFLDEKAIPNFTVFDALKAQGKPEELYYKFDGHFTPLGNRVAAETIAQYLFDDYFPKKAAANK